MSSDIIHATFAMKLRFPGLLPISSDLPKRLPRTKTKEFLGLGACAYMLVCGCTPDSEASVSAPKPSEASPADVRDAASMRMRTTKMSKPLNSAMSLKAEHASARAGGQEKAISSISKHRLLPVLRAVAMAERYAAQDDFDEDHRPVEPVSTLWGSDLTYEKVPHRPCAEPEYRIFRPDSTVCGFRLESEDGTYTVFSGSSLTILVDTMHLAKSDVRSDLGVDAVFSVQSRECGSNDWSSTIAFEFLFPTPAGCGVASPAAEGPPVSPQDFPTCGHDSNSGIPTCPNTDTPVLGGGMPGKLPQPM